MTIELKPLTEDERNKARALADADAVASLGKVPSRDDFKNAVLGKYPNWLTTVVSLMLLVVFVAAGNVSMFRVFNAGRDHFIATINVGWQGNLVGVSAFIMAEFMVIVSTISMAIFFDKYPRRKWFMLIPILMGLALAFYGNWTIAQPTTSWGWLETATPPAAVLFMGIISEQLILGALSRRRANEASYQEAHNHYTTLAEEPRKLKAWQPAYMKRLRDAIRQSNAHGIGAKGRREIMRQMSSREWVLVVQRELAEDAIWEQAAANPTQPAITSGQGDIQTPSDKPKDWGWLPEPQPSASNKSQTPLKRR